MSKFYLSLLANSKKSAIAFLAVLFCLMIRSNDVHAQGPGGAWGNVRTVSLNTPTTLANYQVKITLTTAIMGNPYTNVNSTGSDLRFYDNSNNNCPYWIETFSNIGTSIIWVKIVTSGSSTIQMYYGNPTAIAVSNGNTTFDFFDDFYRQLRSKLVS